MASEGGVDPQKGKEASGLWEPENVEEALRRSEERHRAFIAYASEAIWRYEFDETIPISLPLEEQAARAYRSAYLAECNDAMARMYGFEKAEDILNHRLAEFLGRKAYDEAVYGFILGGYRLTDVETVET